MNSQDIVLAFSGGLDTSFCVPYLKEQGYDPAALKARFLHGRKSKVDYDQLLRRE